MPAPRTDVKSLSMLESFKLMTWLKDHAEEIKLMSNAAIAAKASAELKFYINDKMVWSRRKELGQPTTIKKVSPINRAIGEIVERLKVSGAFNDADAAAVMNCLQ